MLKCLEYRYSAKSLFIVMKLIFIFLIEIIKLVELFVRILLTIFMNKIHRNILYNVNYPSTKLKGISTVSLMIYIQLTLHFY